MTIDAAVRRPSLLRRAVRWLGLAAVVALAGFLANGWKAFGRFAHGERRARMERSPQWKDGRFRNPQPISSDMVGALYGFLSASPYTRPASPLPTGRLEKGRLEVPPTTGLRVTWLGHSTLLVEIDGHRILTDPVWGERSSPFSWIGPRRWYPPLAALDDLSPLDAVVISHDHYDHLDQTTINAMKDWNTTFIVPLGVGANLAYWGVPETRIVELDWWEQARVRDLEIVATPARHASGRFGLVGQDETLWAGYAFRGAKHRAWYSGDTGLFPGLSDIGDHLGPFDVTMVEAGAFGRWWPDWHLGPEQAVKAHRMVRGRAMLPTHWGLFNLAYHGWTEPIERLVVSARESGVVLLTPRPGQSVEPQRVDLATERWWPDVPWNTAAQDPIVSGDGR